jgi:hypothetical protein
MQLRRDPELLQLGLVNALVGAALGRPTSRTMDTTITTLLEYFFQEEGVAGTFFSRGSAPG